MFVEKHSAFKEGLPGCSWPVSGLPIKLRQYENIPSADKGTCPASFERPDYQLGLSVQILTLPIKVYHLGSIPGHVFVPVK